jgi:hypothetical protein
MNSDDFIQASNRHYLIAVFCSLAAALCSMAALFIPFFSAFVGKRRNRSTGEEQ